jgi:rhodanese-related sulfurtransferase
MKKAYSIILMSCLTLAIFSCKKDKGSDEPVELTELTGLWELAETSAAMTPVKTFDPGNGDVISFTEGKYAKYKNGQLINEGSYTVVEDSTVEENVHLINLKDKYTHRLVFDNNYSATKIFIYINKGRLSIISGSYAVDAGHNEVYRSIHNTGLLAAK